MINANQFRHALGHFATGITIVTTQDSQQQPVGITASSFNSVSLSPPLVLWSVAKSAYSYSCFAEAEHFAVHVLGADQTALSDRFARASSDKFGNLELGQGVSGVPLLPGCLAQFECMTEHRYDGGDHMIIVGRVLNMTLSPSPSEPLLFFRGRYAALEKVEAA
jgi:3-hydroxy-9,10-secoandrosta-1,3,5(10)-triene-9,17-dione monooxygenase reductase component